MFKQLLTRTYSSFPLRNYQEEVIESCLNVIQNGPKRFGVSLATGGGKTVIFTNLIKRLIDMDSTFKTLLLVHRRELAQQSMITLKRFMPDLKIQLDMGRDHYDPLKPANVVVGSVPSVYNRLENYAPTNDIDMIIVDEAHHIVAKTYMEILKHFHCDTSDAKVPVIGFSATFERADNIALSQALDEIIYHRGIIEMINDKWLCEGKFTTVSVDMNLDNVQQNSNDFQLNALSRIVNKPEINQIILNTYLQKRKDDKIKSTLLFGTDKNHVKTLNDLFQRNGIRSECITSDFKTSDRDKIIQDFKDGKTEVLMNCGILTEGTDIPNIDCILLCRPTKSRSLLVQMIGRGLRLHHSKEYCHIIDFVGASNVGVVSVPTLVGINNYNEELDDVTLSTLEKIKERLDEKDSLNKMKSLALKKKNENDLDLSLDDIDITLTSYKTFENFILNNSNNDKNDPILLKEMNLIEKSKYPWIRTTSTSWSLDLRDSYMRIHKEAKSDETPTYLLKIYHRIMKNETLPVQKYYSVNLKQSNDLLDIVSKVEQVIAKLSQNGLTGQRRNFTKFSSFKQMHASSKQKLFCKKLLLKVYNNNIEEFKNLKIDTIEKYTQNLNVGQARNIFFAHKIAPVFPIKSILKLLQLRQFSNNF